MNVIDGKEHNQNQLQNYYMYDICYLYKRYNICLCVYKKIYCKKLIESTYIYSLRLHSTNINGIIILLGKPRLFFFPVFFYFNQFISWPG